MIDPDFDPYAEALIVLNQLSDEQVMRYCGTGDRESALQQLVAERAAAGPAGVVSATTISAEDIPQHAEGLRVRAEATRTIDPLLKAVQFGAFGFSGLFLFGGIIAMIWSTVTKDRPTPVGLKVLVGVIVVSMVLGFLGLILNAVLARVAEKRRRRAQLEWASHRRGQLGRGLPGVTKHALTRVGLQTGRLTSAMVILGLLTTLVGGIVVYTATQDGDLSLWFIGLLMLVLGLALAWVGWKIPGWERARDARDDAASQALALRPPFSRS